VAKKQTAKAKKAAEGKRIKKRLEIWVWLLANGWYRRQQPASMNCLYRTPPANSKLRFNFKDDCLRMEVKVETTKEQREINPRVNSGWVVLDEDTYENTSLDENGPVFIHKEVKKASTRKDR